FRSLRHHRTLPSFPTRRSSDLIAEDVAIDYLKPEPPQSIPRYQVFWTIRSWNPEVGNLYGAFRRAILGQPGKERLQAGFFEQGRSEEHTSELQSRFDLVCRLLL